jgi:NADH dehydrogenase
MAGHMKADNIDKAKPDHHVVIVGGGFAGLHAAQSLRHARVRITLIDKRNFHLFQPLLYQVATGDLSITNIVAPLRVVLKKQKNVRVILGEVTRLDPSAAKIFMDCEETSFDSLILATGSGKNYFGNDRWEPFAPSLKTIEDAFDIRNRMVSAFEMAEKEPDPGIKKELLSFIVIGGGSTGVELAGALAEVANDTLRQEYRTINRGDAAITIIEGRNHILPAFPEELSIKAEKAIARLGIKIITGAHVCDINEKGVSYKIGDKTEFLPSRTVIWAAGVKASGLGKAVADSTGSELDRMGRVIVQPDCSVPGFENIFVVGDLANFQGENGNPLPGLAPVAMQQGRYVARLIQSRLKGVTMPGFKYINRGTMSILGRNSGVAFINGMKFHGWFAWFLWLFVHLVMIIQFGNRILILMQWGWKYFAKSHYARILTNVRDCDENPLQ